MEDKIEELRGMIKIQSSSGHWNYSPYLLGMANGSIFALSIMTGEEAKYLNPPKEYLCDKTISGEASDTIGKL